MPIPAALVRAARLAVLAVALTAVPFAARAAPPALEQPEVSIAVGGRVAFYYLPLSVADWKGYFRDEGLTVRILDFQGGAKSVQAVVGGSADVLSSSFEHVVTLQAKGQELQAFLLQGRFPGFSLSLSKAAAERYRSPADLKGLKIGVTAPGSSTHTMVNLLLAKAGLKPDAVTAIGVGAGASVVASLRNGLVDGVVQADPVTTLLAVNGDAVVKVDTRTEAGTVEVYGGAMPAASISARRDFVQRNPRTVQALTNAMVRALRFIQSASDEELVAMMPPEMTLGGDRALMGRILAAVRPSYSPDGRIPREAAETAVRVLKGEIPAVRDAEIDLSRASTNAFVDAALKGM